jgi:hypothetical protein
MIGWLILACEIGFWIFVIAGLFARYVLRQKKLGVLLLLCTPLIDLALIIFTIIDLRNGAEAEFIHGLAAIYVGVTIAFGHQMIRWADVRFAYIFTGGPKPKKPAKYGTEHARREREGWYRHLLAYVIGVVLLFGIVFLSGNAEKTDILLNMSRGWSVILLIDFVISFSYTLWPRSSR